MGWSRRGSLKGFPATVTDWTDKDFNAMLGEARKAAPDLQAQPGPADHHRSDERQRHQEDADAE